MARGDRVPSLPGRRLPTELVKLNRSEPFVLRRA